MRGPIAMDLSRFCAALLLACGCWAGAGRTVAAEGDFYPRGNVFCFTFYSTSMADARYTLDNGATAIGPYYGDQAGPLEHAARWNTRFIYKINPPSMSRVRVPDMNKPGFVWPDAGTISNEVVAIVNAMKTNRHIAMWDVEPEELRSWEPAQNRYLKQVSSAIRSADPEGRPIFLYECNNRGAGVLAESLKSLDVVSKGTYVNFIQDGAYITNRIWARWSMEEELKAIALGNTNAVPWIMLWMAADPPPGYTAASVTNWCRHDAYAGLIMGGKGIEIWSGSRGRTSFSKASFDAYLNGYLTVARDLNGPLNLAPVFLFGTQQTNVSMTITAGPKQLNLAYLNTTNSYPPVTFLATRCKGTNYLFAVNSAEVPVTAVFSGLPPAMRSEVFNRSDEQTPNGTFQVTFAPLAVKGWRFATPEPALSPISPAGRGRPVGENAFLK